MFFYRDRRGFTLIGVLIALVIVMILAGHYFKKDEETQRNYVETQLDKSRDAACAVNLRNLEGAISMWQINHTGEKVTVENLRRDGINIPRCPDNQDYIIKEDGLVYCPIHQPEPGATSTPERVGMRGAGLPSAPGPSGPGTVDRVKRQLEQ
ncbi:MAG TPA: prepilin-type N-terminal cleavage/methylation domain-containing protein [Candidatus Sumerlaeota bacterium]|nr:prepilin-type N-terminal cleavage/methylation domain-containing protein [Candidatus Sumerlaeota bacterium]